MPAASLLRTGECSPSRPPSVELKRELDVTPRRALCIGGRTRHACALKLNRKCGRQVTADSHRPETGSNQTEQYRFEIEGSDVEEPPAREVSGEVNEIVEWFDVGIESQGAVSAGQHQARESLAGLMQDDSAGEFH